MKCLILKGKVVYDEAELSKIVSAVKVFSIQVVGLMGVPVIWIFYED
jgi:hypothetical protein